MKLFLISIFMLLFSSGVVVAKDIKVFGVKTLESVFEYVDSLSSAEPHNETLGRKYDQIWITPPKLNSSFDYYGLVYDKETKTVQGLISLGEMFDFDHCLGQMEGWLPKIEKRFLTDLEKFEQKSDGMVTVGASQWVEIMNSSQSNFQYIDIRCNQYSDGDIALVLLWRTESLADAVEEYYDDF